MNYLDLLDKIGGALFGFAIGDALGATNEFRSKEQIERVGKVTEIVGGGWLNLKPGEVTDDTQMMFCVYDALHMAKLFSLTDNDDILDVFLDTCSSNFLKWYESDPKDIGNCCAKVISGFQNLKEKKYERMLGVARRVDKARSSLGNGGLMRCLPCCFLEDERFAVLQSALTHNNAISMQCVKVYRKALRICLFAESRIDAALQIQNLVVENKNLFENHMDDEFLFSGHVVNTLYHALESVILYDSYEDAVLYIVNNGGDSDTIGALAGGLYGCLVGYNKLPYKFVNGLQNDVRSALFLAARNLTTDLAREYRKPEGEKNES